ncbi:MAG: hypothetical protein ACRCRZ_00395 [Metamycoplasmataceae bacterium]
MKKIMLPLISFGIITISSSILISCSSQEVPKKDEVTAYINQLFLKENFKPTLKLDEETLSLNNLSEKNIVFIKPKENNSNQDQLFDQINFSVVKIFIPIIDQKNTEIMIKVENKLDSSGWYQNYIFNLKDLNNYDSTKIVAISESDYMLKLNQLLSSNDIKILSDKLQDIFTKQWLISSNEISDFIKNEELFEITKKQIENQLNVYGSLPFTNKIEVDKNSLVLSYEPQIENNTFLVSMDFKFYVTSSLDELGNLRLSDKKSLSFILPMKDGK